MIFPRVLIFVLLFAFPAHAEELVGKVVSIAEGDTLTVLQDDQQFKIRLAGIDAPEKGQAFGTAAKKHLSDQVFGKKVRVEWEKKDRYGRILGAVYLDREWVNLDMVETGYAWHYKQYSKDEKLAEAEKTARGKKLGLWQDKEPTRPWEYRKQERSKTR